MPDNQKKTPKLDPDEVIVTIGQKQISGWSEAEIRCGIDIMPWAAQLSVTFDQPAGDDNDKITFTEGDEAIIRIGEDKIITGYLVTVTENFTASSHTVMLDIASKSIDLVECSAEIFNGQLNDTNAHHIIREIVKFAGIDVTVAGSVANIDVKTFSLIPSETPHDIMDRLCRMAGILFYDNPDGGITLTSGVAEEKSDDGKMRPVLMGTGCVWGQNIESLTRQRSQAGRYSIITAILTNDQIMFNEPGENEDYYSQMQAITAPGCVAEDITIGRMRPLLIPSEQADANYEVSKKRVEWEKVRRFGAAYPVQIIVDSWRNDQGRLWQVNTLCEWSGPNGKILAWLITGIVFSKSLNGTRAELTLTVPQAFQPQPIVNPANSAKLNQALNS